MTLAEFLYIPEKSQSYIVYNFIIYRRMMSMEVAIVRERFRDIPFGHCDNIQYPNISQLVGVVVLWILLL